MRIIDADAAKTNVRETFLGASDFAADVRNACCAAIDKAPTVTGNAAAANVPLSAEQLRDMGGMPYWHDSLDGDIGHWAILDPQVALHPKDYHYGETWIAYAMIVGETAPLSFEQVLQRIGRPLWIQDLETGESEWDVLKKISGRELYFKHSLESDYGKRFVCYDYEPGSLNSVSAPLSPWHKGFPDCCGMPVLLAVKNRFGQKNVIEGFTGYMEHGRLEFHTNDPGTNLSVWKVIGWMPKPEPPED